MNYQRIYDEIIERSKSRGLNKKKLEGYFERHHIIPRCMQGTNDRDNLVLLTAREHYLCHWLLWKCNKESRSLFYAYRKMLYCNNQHQERTYLKCSSEYEAARIAHNKFQVGKQISEETRKKMSESHKGLKQSKEQIEINRIAIINSQKYWDAMKSPERSKRISDSKLGIPSGRKGIPMTEEQKEKLRGRVVSEETKKKLSESRIGKQSWNLGMKCGPLSDEQRANISKSLKGRIVSDETKLKLKALAIEREKRKKLLKSEQQN